MMQPPIKPVVMLIVNTVFLICSCFLIVEALLTEETTLEVADLPEAAHLTDSARKFITRPLVTVTLNICVILLTIFGFVSAFTKGMYYIRLYALLMMIIFIATLIVFIYAVMEYECVDIYEPLTDMMKEYNSNKNIKIIIDGLQIKYKCCGIVNERDWIVILGQIPISCYKEFEIVTEGCLYVVTSSLQVYVWRKILIILAILLMMGFGLFVMIVLTAGLD